MLSLVKSVLSLLCHTPLLATCWKIYLVTDKSTLFKHCYACESTVSLSTPHSQSYKKTVNKNYTSHSLTVTCPARSWLRLPHWQQRKTALLSCHSWALSGRCLPLRMAGELTWQAALLRSLHMAHFQEHKAISVSSHHSNKLLSHNGYAISSPIGLFLCTCLKGVVHPKKKKLLTVHNFRPSKM